MIIPRHIQIETIHGMCTSRCIMCSYKSWKRKKLIMPNEIFSIIMHKFLPYQAEIEYVSLHGWGEPLLDNRLPEKIKLAKDLGFKGTGLATNCTELDERMSLSILEAGLDTLICSIDGIKKKTHESIRVGTDFEKVVHNVKNFFQLRNATGKTRVIIRFIRQEQNKEEWEAYQEYWTPYIEKGFGDEILKFDIHNSAGSVENYEYCDLNRHLQLGDYVCQELWKRMIILADGRVAFCDTDMNNTFYNLGNIIDANPIEIFNNEIYRRVRTMMQEGKILELEHCNICTLPRSRYLKTQR